MHVVILPAIAWAQIRDAGHGQSRQDGWVATACPGLPHAVPATVKGSPEALYGTWDQPLCVLGCTVTYGKIAEIHLIANRAKLRHLPLSFTPGPAQRPQ
jgi:hypothetical protein